MEETKEGLRRTTTFEKYIGGADLPTLTVKTGVSVMRLVLQRDMETGVQYSDANGNQTIVYARREVVLSAGAIASPAILLRSGVGDADTVRAHDIGLAQHIPEVGRNFYDDLGLGFPAFTAADLPPNSLRFRRRRHLRQRSRPSAPIRPPSARSISKCRSPPAPWPGRGQPGQVPFAMIGVSAMHLESRGTVSLDPANPYGHPLVDPAWLTVTRSWRACASDTACVSPAASSRSRAYSRSTCSIENRASPAA